MTESEAKRVERFLIQKDYIDLDGQLTQKFKDVGITEEDVASAGEETRELIGPRADFLHAAISAVYDPRAVEDICGNALETKVVRNDLNEYFRKKEFQELWARVNHKSAYTVSFDSEELRGKAIDNINRNLSVSVPKYELVRGNQADTVSREQAEGSEGFKIAGCEMREVSAAGGLGVMYDLVGEVARRATVTRETAAAILTANHPNRFAMFRLNPEEFIAKAGDAIVEEKATMVVEHIRYNQLEDTCDASIFTQSMPESSARSLKGERSIQDYVFWDSETEREFAKELDENVDVCDYARLPRSFQIPTPVGNYAPYWAIAFHDGSVKHILFVAETKSSMSTLNLNGNICLL